MVLATGGQNLSSSSQVYTPNSVNRVAISFVKDDTASSLGKLSISTNGIATDTTFSDQPMPTGLTGFDIGHANEVAGTAIGYIRKIEVYALKDDADLPDLSSL